MPPNEIRRLVASLDTRDAAKSESAWAELRPLGVGVVPVLLELFPGFRCWQGRTALVFHAIRHARTSEAAFQLGLAALRDRSFMVRYRGCGLLAYSLRKDAMPALEALRTHSDRRTVEDADAALDAIAHQDHHRFVDRDHSGRTRWVVNDGD